MKEELQTWGVEELVVEKVGEILEERLHEKKREYLRAKYEKISEQHENVKDFQASWYDVNLQQKEIEFLRNCGKKQQVF